MLMLWMLLDPQPTKVDITGSLNSLFTTFSAFTGALGGIALLYAGYLWIFAGNNHQNVERARLAVGSAIAGMILCLVAYTLAQLVIGDVH